MFIPWPLKQGCLCLVRFFFLWGGGVITWKCIIFVLIHRFKNGVWIHDEWVKIFESLWFLVHGSEVVERAKICLRKKMHNILFTYAEWKVWKNKKKSKVWNQGAMNIVSISYDRRKGNYIEHQKHGIVWSIYVLWNMFFFNS